MMSDKRISILAQILIFTGLAILQCLPLFWKVYFPIEYWIKQSLMFAVWVGIFYLSLKVLLPFLLFRGRWGFFLLSVILLVLPSVLIFSHVSDNLLDLHAVLNKHFNVDPKKEHPDKALLGDFGTVIITLLVIGSSTVIGFGEKLRSESQLRENLEKEKVTSELSFLKSQINPHFFFNILNSIYALTDTDVTAARAAIYNLSHLMRYVLYDTQNNLTSLQKEVAFVEDYLKLMELRITSNVQVIFDKPAIVKDVEVAPMLFLPFIENAFKHGISSIHPSYIYIGLRQTENTIEIEVRNSLFEEQALNKEESNGIGIGNTKRRLDLIYPGRYELDIDKNTAASEFSVSLKLKQL
ncbi:sensor histidine kinase [Flavobacterium silvaticum]|uniref:Sensor histidine kinase n=1 Tax=Flavobacterium silvaticum TaxID=1852020 RepID=A0A972FRK0_9FLAO|nr:histidine kinase [Flavobacterium silvaticum]NMH28069.1 sensor histidine kinase [Flavobacterium silvaticum]